MSGCTLDLLIAREVAQGTAALEGRGQRAEITLHHLFPAGTIPFLVVGRYKGKGKGMPLA